MVSLRHLGTFASKHSRLLPKLCLKKGGQTKTRQLGVPYKRNENVGEVYFWHTAAHQKKREGKNECVKLRNEAYQSGEILRQPTIWSIHNVLWGLPN